MKPALRSILSGIVAAALLALGSWLADRYNLPFIHTWALMHGAFLVLLPLYFVAAYLLLGFAASGRASASTRPPYTPLVLAVLSVIFAAIGALLPFASLPGVALGHFARSRSRSASDSSSRVVALVGLIVGYLTLAFWLYAFVVVLSVSRAHR